MIMSDPDIGVCIEVPFPTETLARITYDVLRVDAEPRRGRVVKELKLEGTSLKVVFKGSVASKLRVAVNTFFDHLNLALRTIDFAGEAMSQDYSHY